MKPYKIFASIKNVKRKAKVISPLSRRKIPLWFFKKSQTIQKPQIVLPD